MTNYVSAGYFPSQNVFFCVVDNDKEIQVFEPRGSDHSQADTVFADNSVIMEDDMIENNNEVRVDLFSDRDSEGQVSGFQAEDPTNTMSFARKLIYEVGRLLGLAAYNQMILSFMGKNINQLRFRCQEITIEDYGFESPSLMEEYYSLLRKQRVAEEAFEFAEANFGTINKAVAWCIDEIVPSDIRSEVMEDFKQVLLEEPEILNGDIHLRRAMREMAKEGSGKYRAAQEREVSLITTDGMVHIGHGLLPEEEYDYNEEDNRVIIPYLRVPGTGEIVTYNVPFLENDTWTKKEVKALSVFITMKNNEGVWTTFPMVHAIFKYQKMGDRLRALSEEDNWIRVKQIRLDNDLPQKWGAPLAAKVREIRQAMYTWTREVQEGNEDWSFFRKPAIGLPKARYMSCIKEFMGKKVRVSIQIVN